MLNGVTNFISSGYILSSLLLVVGFMVLLYIGWNSRTEIWICGNDVVTVKVVDCKSQEIYRCSFDQFLAMKFDEIENAAYFFNDDVIIGIGVGISEGKRMINVVSREFKKLG